MLFHKGGQEIRKTLLPFRSGTVLLLLFVAVLAAWGWLGKQDLEPEQEALSMNQQAEIPSPMEDEPDSAEGEQEVGDKQESQGAAAAYFAAYRLEREESRAAELTMLENIIVDPYSSEEAISQAEQRRIELAAAGSYELQAESLLLAKGFGETVVIFGESLATVIVDVEMDSQKAACIAQAVDSISGCGFENVVVVNR